MRISYGIYVRFGFAQLAFIQCYFRKSIKSNEIATKAETPTVTKTVDEGAKGTSASAGEAVSFTLTGTVPTTEVTDYYDTYTYKFVDALSADLTYVDDSISVKATGDVTPEYTLTKSTSGKTLIIEITNAKALAGQTITVTYKATLGEDAYSLEPEYNTVKVVYSNDPNGTGTGTTTSDKVYVYTFDLTVNKVDGNGNALSGAAFTLYKKDANGTYQVVKATTAGDATSFTFNDLGEGDYKIEETTTPAGYNTIKPVEFTISATYSDDGSSVTKLSGGTLSGDSFASSSDNKTLAANVINNAGTDLPSTGGIGTTIFYVVGSVMIFGAAVLLITKKRVGRE